MQTQSAGIVAPGNPVASLNAGSHTVTIISARGENDGLLDGEGNPAVSENQEIILEYPDGFRKTHQVANREDLLVRMTATLRGRYGVETVTFVTVPESLEAEQQITVEV